MFGERYRAGVWLQPTSEHSRNVSSQGQKAWMEKKKLKAVTPKKSAAKWTVCKRKFVDTGGRFFIEEGGEEYREARPPPSQSFRRSWCPRTRRPVRNLTRTLLTAISSRHLTIDPDPNRDRWRCRQRKRIVRSGRGSRSSSLSGWGLSARITLHGVGVKHSKTKKGCQKGDNGQW